MSGFYEEVEGIYRLKIPFDTVYTSVFLIKAPSRVILVDCATTARDVEDVILPALAKMGYAPKDVNALVLTHRHGDHAGGLDTLLQHAPQLEVVTDIRVLADGVCTYPMGGHTKDAVGVLCTRTGTLISGDGIQGAGVDKYRCYTEDPKMYLETLARIREDARIENILFSHAYEPWLADRASGREQVLACLDASLQYVT
jgi:glyoxylase-like metal-dependent hydrolase (beta-lactamase superfamily II)